MVCWNWYGSEEDPSELCERATAVCEISGLVAFYCEENGCMVSFGIWEDGVWYFNKDYTLVDRQPGHYRPAYDPIPNVFAWAPMPEPPGAKFQSGVGWVMK